MRSKQRESYIHHEDVLSPLLRITSPYDQESLSSYVYRLGIINDYDEPWITKAICLNRPKIVWGSWLNRIDDPAVINRISELTLLKNEDIIRMTIHYFSRYISPNAQRLYLENIKAPLYTAGKYCPACMLEKPHQQIQWDLPYITLCLEHRCVLVDTCRLCGRKLGGNYVIRGRCSCGAGLAGQPMPIHSGNDEILYQELIYSMLGLGGRGAIPGFSESPAYSLHPSDFFTLLDVIASNVKYIPQFCEKVSLASPNLYNHIMYHEAVNVLSDWPQNFFEFLRSYRQTPKVTYLKTGLERDFAPLLRTIKRRLKDKRFEFLTAAIEEYLVSEWNGGVLTTKITTFPKIAERADEQRYVTLAQAEKELRTKRDILIELVKAGKLTAIVKKVGTHYTQYLIERKSLDGLKSKWRNLLGDKQVADILGIGKRMVASLAKAGILQPSRGKAVDGYPTWLFEEQYIKSFVSRYRSVTALNNSSPGDLLSFHDATKYLSFYSVNMQELIGLIDEGQLSPSVDLNKTGLAAMMFKRSDLEKYAETQKERRRNNLGMTIQEAAKFLGVKDVVVKRWANRGLLQVSRSVDLAGSKKIYIPEANLYKFKEEYLFTEEVAERLGVTPQTVAEWSRQGKLHACSGQRIDGGGRLLFKASEIRQIDSKIKNEYWC